MAGDTAQDKITGFNSQYYKRKKRETERQGDRGRERVRGREREAKCRGETEDLESAWLELNLLALWTRTALVTPKFPYKVTAKRKESRY